MATYTEHLHLVKPAPEDYADITVLNNNMDIIDSGLLPLTGGTMTGDISNDGDFTLSTTTNRHSIALQQGTYNGGASLYLYGAQNSNSDKGTFKLNATNGQTNYNLTGDTSGNLTWGGSVIGFNDGGSVYGNNMTSGLVLYGADGWNNGASLFLRGGDHSSKGGFDIWALSDSKGKSLSGRPDGTLTWDSNTVVVEVGKSSMYVKYNNGLLMQWGQVVKYSSSGFHEVTVTLHQPFANTNYRVMTSDVGNYRNSDNDLVTWSYSTTSFKTYTDTNNGKNWFAIGFWK